MKLFNVSFVTLILRFYLLMAVVIVAFFAGIPWLSILALPIFLSAMLGVQLSRQATRAPKPRPNKVLHPQLN